MSLKEWCYESMAYLHPKYDEPSDSARASVPEIHEHPTRRREDEDLNPVSSRVHQRSELRSYETGSPTPTDRELRDLTRRREGEDHNPVSSRAHQRSELRSYETRFPTPTDRELRDPTRRREGEDHNPVSSRAHQRSELRSYETGSRTPTDRELRDPSQVHESHRRRERSIKTDRDFATEDRAYAQMEDELEKMQQRLKAENAELKKAEGEKEEWKQKAIERRKRLIKITAELNRVVGSAQGFRKDDDSALRTKAEYLRADIRDIPSCHLKERQVEIFEPTYKLFEDRLQLSESIFKKYLQSRSTRSELVQAFIWDTLCVEIFGRFGWVPESAASAMIAMSEFLDKIPDATTIPDAKRTFHVWRATTTNTMVEALKLDRELVMQHASKRSEALTQSTIAGLSDLLQLSDRKELEERFRGIFHASFELSEMIDTQLASVIWTPMGRKVAAQPDSRKSQPVKGHQGNNPVKLIVAPGLVRRGKSSGDNFDEEVVEILPLLSGHRV